jgi:hypothetical protein
MLSELVRINAVDNHPDADRLSLVSLSNGQTLVANLHEDGSLRWNVDDLAVYVFENAIIPDDILRERGYWDDTKNKGYLGGSKGNRVKMQRFVGVESRGIIFKVDDMFDEDGYLLKLVFTRGSEWYEISEDNDFDTFLGLTEYVPQ